MVIIYHNPRCSKSRMALAHIQEKGLEVKQVEYLKNFPSKPELKAILEQLGMKAEDLIRKGEAIYKERYKGRSLTEEEWIDAMIENPKLMERPIVINNGKAVVARPLERLEEIL